jgi:hypothetical protein
MAGRDDGDAAAAGVRVIAFDRQIARISAWCARHGYEVHVPLRGPVRIVPKAWRR